MKSPQSEEDQIQAGVKKYIEDRDKSFYDSLKKDIFIDELTLRREYIAAYKAEYESITDKSSIEAKIASRAYSEVLAEIEEDDRKQRKNQIESYREEVDKELSVAGDEESLRVERIELYKQKAANFKEKYKESKLIITPQADIVTQPSNDQVKKKQRDIAIIAYYESLDELREFYRKKVEQPREADKKQYEIKLHDLDAIIWENKAKEARRNGREDGAEKARANSMLAKAAANKLRQEDKRATIIKDAPEVAEQYKNKKIEDHDKFLRGLEGLEARQKKAKFVANFLEKSAEMYIKNYNSPAKGDEKYLGTQFEVLLRTNGDKDLLEAEKKIRDNLPAYIKQMNKDLGGKLRMYGLGDHDRANILSNSLYVITAQRLNKLVDSSIGKSDQEKEVIAKKSEGTIMRALKFMTGGFADQVYQKVMNKYNKSQVVSAIKNLGISEANAILHPRSTPVNQAIGVGCRTVG